MSTAIEWTDETWSPITGCTKVSPGCANCYALRMAARLKAMGNPRYQKDGGQGSGPGFGVSLHPDVLGEPLSWRKPRRVFVVSMGDLFHEDVPDEFIDQVFQTMMLARQHTFQVLTKRADRMAKYEKGVAADVEGWPLPVEKGAARISLVTLTKSVCDWPLPNVWLGVSVENQRMADERIPLLLETPAAVRFLSCEPLLGPLDLTRFLHDTNCTPGCGPGHRCGPELGWVIVGGESGPGRAERRLVERCDNLEHWARSSCSCCANTGWAPKPHALEWLRSIRDQCQAAGVPFFFKQYGGPKPKSGGRLLDGREWNEMPQREAVPA